ncbi:MAG: hypothetical protein RAO94_00915 [Candidatus Stygibacter australis]|nr:hypothetical protein [Candidatus Stygibacter australis]MDP8320889.1 hypothetical protein [Candidatus Stygibacter australis]
MSFKTGLLVIIVAVICLLSGCADTTRRYPFFEKEFSTRNIMQGKLITPGCKIESISGDFVINSGEVFTSPFQCACVVVNRSTGIPIFLPTRVGKKDIIERFDVALSNGARKVLVKVPGLSEKLYGVLWLGTVLNTATGPQTRSYQIEIPESYINAAIGGKVSVIYEIADAHKVHEVKSENDYWISEREHFTWVLWISDVPF